jgi:hypothetical protein
MENPRQGAANQERHGLLLDPWAISHGAICLIGTNVSYDNFNPLRSMINALRFCCPRIVVHCEAYTEASAQETLG